MNDQINIVILGNLDTGKSSICLQLSDTERETQPTTGIQETKLVRTYNSQEVNIKLVDTSGDPHFMDLIEPELIHADAILYVFSFNDEESYDDLNYWIQLAQPFVDEYTTLMIVGNKSQDKNIGANNPQQFSRQKDMLFTEVSALYKFGLEQMLTKIIDSVFEKRKKKQNKIVSSVDIDVINKLKQNKDTKKISIGIIGDPSIGNFRIFKKVIKQFNTIDNIKSLSKISLIIVPNYLSQKAQIIVPEQKCIIQILDITDNQLKKLLTNPDFESPQILLIVFSVESLRSFQNLETYLNMFDDNPNIIIVATKSTSSKRQVSKQTLIKYAQQKIFKSFELADKNSQNQIENIINYILSLNLLNNEKQQNQQKQLSEKEHKIETTNQSQNQSKQISNKDSSNSSSSSSILIKMLVGLGVLGILAFAFTKYRK